jgi:hypothetical protein
VAAVVIPPEEAKTQPEEGTLLQYFFRGCLPRFCWGFWQNRVVERGFLMVNLRWIAGESW